MVSLTSFCGLSARLAGAVFLLVVGVSGAAGAGELSPAAAQFLDAVGNHNGRYDVGDLRAFLQVSGELPGATASHRSGSAP